MLLTSLSASFGPCASLLLRRTQGLAAHVPRPGRPRCFASVALTNEDGPLAGIRVLDLTRVLAGVCPQFFCAATKNPTWFAS